MIRLDSLWQQKVYEIPNYLVSNVSPEQELKTNFSKVSNRIWFKKEFFVQDQTSWKFADARHEINSRIIIPVVINCTYCCKVKTCYSNWQVELWLGIVLALWI